MSHRGNSGAPAARLRAAFGAEEEWVPRYSILRFARPGAFGVGPAVSATAEVGGPA